jgi:excinuclease ABC subunit A
MPRKTNHTKVPQTPVGPHSPSGKHSDIVIRGARVHNLKNVSLTLPRNKLIVMTGVSGSGKSSLAFDTIYSEGQRRYVESLSSYARQFLERMEKPDVDLIQGISPAIAIEQKTTSRNPRSTVATTTEIYDYLRLLFGRVGRTFCRVCGKPVQRASVTTAVDRILQEPEGSKLYVMFPMDEHPGSVLQTSSGKPASAARTSPGRPLKEELGILKQRGFFRLIADGELIDLNEHPYKSKSKKGLFILVDRLILRKEDQEGMTRLADSLGTAFEEGRGYAFVQLIETKKVLKFSRRFECSEDGIEYEEPQPQLFSFNNPVGACPVCQGFGRIMGVDMDLVVPDPTKTIRQGAVLPWTFPRWRENLIDLLRIAGAAGIPVDVPFQTLKPEHIALIMNGTEGFQGLRKFFKFIEKKSYKVQYRVFMSRFRGYTICDECGGSRLRKEALDVRIAEKTIADIVRMTVGEAKQFFDVLVLSDYEMQIAKRILEEIRKRLRFLDGIGLAYLTLDRLTMTLSGGESQRINLATSLGSALMGALYVLDEPTIGLHPRDNAKLVAQLKSLRDIGNTVIVVEHDEEMMRGADVVVDMGPHAGRRGGEIIYCGEFDGLLKQPASLTARYLNGTMTISVPKRRRPDTEQSIYIRGASEHNLKNIDLRIPLNMFVCITGVSGSGKSTLVHDVLYAGLMKRKGGFEGTAGKCRSIEGTDYVGSVEMVDQSPIGRSPRSNAATYLKVFDLIRDLLAHTPAAKVHGYTPGHFSFNVPGGRCEVCEGDGVQKIEMQFMADIYLPCESCKGKRFRKEILEIRFHGKNVDDILSMTATEAIDFFSQMPEGKRIVKRLQVLDNVGLGYIRLGQAGTTFSGGEAQRLKLAFHLSEPDEEGKKLFIFDEPTTGLHFDDIAKLLVCFDRLVQAGHSIIVIEHNMEVVKCADFVIDLGPEAGAEGGSIVGTGSPEEIAMIKKSSTGQFLRRVLAEGKFTNKPDSAAETF